MVKSNHRPIVKAVSQGGEQPFCVTDAIYRLQTDDRSEKCQSSYIEFTRIEIEFIRIEIESIRIAVESIRIESIRIEYIRSESIRIEIGKLNLGLKLNLLGLKLNLLGLKKGN